LVNLICRPDLVVLAFVPPATYVPPATCVPPTTCVPTALCEAIPTPTTAPRGASAGVLRWRFGFGSGAAMAAVSLFLGGRPRFLCCAGASIAAVSLFFGGRPRLFGAGAGASTAASGAPCASGAAAAAGERPSGSWVDRRGPPKLSSRPALYRRTITSRVLTSASACRALSTSSALSPSNSYCKRRRRILLLILGAEP
jgi:hypothetical protein